MKKRRWMLACTLALCTALSVPAFQVCAEEVEVETLDTDPELPENESINENIPDEEQIITYIHTNCPLPSNWMIAVGDYDEWDFYQTMLDYSVSPENFIGQTEQTPEVLLNASADLSAVNLEQPGEYPITVTLSISDKQDYPGNYVIPEDLSIMTRTIKVSRPEDFELWIYKSLSDSFEFQFVKELDSSCQLYVLESDRKMDEQELANGDWQIDTHGWLWSNRTSMSVPRYELEQGRYYYFQIRSEDTSSSIVMLQDNGETYESQGITGNRDGSSDDPGADDVIQPAPRPNDPADEPDEPEEPEQPAEEPVLSPAVPEETPAQPETSEQPETPAPSKDSAPMESFTEDSDTVYGTRLDLTRKNHGGNASFSKHGIQVTLSSDTLDSLDVGTDDSLTVELKQETPSSVTLSVSKNGEPVTEIPETEITVPVDGDLYSFTVQETGIYELPETENDSQNENASAELPPSDPSGGLFSGSGLPIYLGLSALSLGGIFLILRRRIFR